MKILIVGGGGREHALAWKLSLDSCNPEIFCAPGNAGTSEVATNIALDAEDIKGIRCWAKKNRPDLTIIGPEIPLCAGITDLMEAEGFRVFGPSKAAARIEGSKVFAKEIMKAAGIPTARSQSFTDMTEAIEYIRKETFPIVIKAEGLAAGKGVLICSTLEEGEKAINDIMVEKVFGKAGEKVLVEEFLVGEEASILAFVDGENVVMLASSQDHKRIFDNDLGPNTGGMGAYSPTPIVTDNLWKIIRNDVFDRTLTELKRRGITYKGVLYAGIMITSKGPYVLEFNCRFGDPETQVILPRIDSDLIPALEACIDGTLKDDLISWRSEACVCVVMASGGYPGKYKKGEIINGLKTVMANENTTVFHAGTSMDNNGNIVTSGGRVLAVSGLGENIETAVKNVYNTVSKINFNQSQYRTDIAVRALTQYIA